MEMIYLVADGDLLKMDTIFEMKAHQFLFMVEYLIRKRRIENIKK